MGRRARAASDFAGELLKYLADFDFIKKQDVKTEAEDMAKYILMQRSQGKANLIDDWDMKQADDQFLYDFTPLHMNTEAIFTISLIFFSFSGNFFAHSHNLQLPFKFSFK